MSSEVKLLSDNIFEFLQPKLLERELLGTLSNNISDSSSSDKLSDECSSEDNSTHEDKDEGEDISMSGVSSNDDSSLANGELDSTNDRLDSTDDRLDSTDTEDVPPMSLCMQVFNELKQMYANHYKTPCKQLPKL